ncbi:MAG: hypothetical protein C5B50_06080 [Verrucomicrobia bacterium]|nr:MAG: hypothetical protein C5B50_06080 [Verrucomicrobiota bacterium]
MNTDNQMRNPGQENEDRKMQTKLKAGKLCGRKNLKYIFLPQNFPAFLFYFPRLRLLSSALFRLS